MIKTWLIYKHTNKINGKSYIGQTCLTTQKRWHIQGQGYLTKKFGKYCQPKFAAAILKYGWDNFTHQVLKKDISTKQKANEYEQYYIKKYDTIKNGYNIIISTDTERTINSRSKTILKLDAHKNIIARYPSAAMAAASVGVIDSANIIACCKHRCNSYKNYYWCFAEDYDTYTIRLKNTMPQSCKRQIIQLSLDNKFIAKFNSIAEAAKILGINQPNISKCLAKIRNKAGNFKFIYAENYEE